MQNLEFRAIDNIQVDNQKIIGRPVVYNSRSVDLGGFVEVISPGAFKDSLNGDIRALYEHDHKMLLGRTTSGTMAISEDNEGLLVEITPPNTRSASELIESINRGDISGMSFGFTVNQDGQQWDFEQTPALRTITNANLSEVTITALPAYQATDVQVAQRSMTETYEEQLPIENWYVKLSEV